MENLNKYIKELNRVEFTVTNLCNGRCKHCSEGDLNGGFTLDGQKAAEALKKLASHYNIKSIMTFGGEALLYPESVYAIHKMAMDCGIPKRQLITNGCFSKKPEKIKEVACKLQECGVNDILLSVDCFHVEHLPLEWVRQFAVNLIENYKGRFRLQPSWVRDRNESNPYNDKTRECLDYFSDLGIELNEGDVIFPEGNAPINLPEYFEKKPLDMNFQCGDELYSLRVDDVDELSINSDGDVIPCSFSIGNIYKNDIIDIIKQYDPYANPLSKALLEKGICGLIEEARKENIPFDLDKHFSPCSVCREIVKNSKKLK